MRFRVKNSRFGNYARVFVTDFTISYSKSQKKKVDESRIIIRKSENVRRNTLGISFLYMFAIHFKLIMFE